MSVVPLSQLAVGDAVALAGPKIGRLVELAGLGITVPQGFVVTSDAFAEHLRVSGLGALIDERLSHARPDDAEGLTGLSAAAREAVRATEVSAPVRRQILTGYRLLGESLGEVNPLVAVRSSASCEDGDVASFAGVFDTYLGVSEAGAVVDAVRRCWASLYADRAVEYRLRHQIPPSHCAMAVGVLELVSARSSGVAFSCHPLTHKNDRVVIEANWGWGEAVVQGRVTPDHVEVGKADRRVLLYRTSDKHLASVFDQASRRVVERPLPAHLRAREVLGAGEIERIVDAVLRIEDHYRRPCDIEWVIDRHHGPDDPVTVVQVRPVSAGVPQEGPEPAPRQWDSARFALRYAFGVDVGT